MEAIGLIELKSIAKGIEVCDTMLKTASVDLIDARPICPGKYICLIGGEVGAVQNSVESGLEIGGIAIVDSLIIPNIHSQVFPALSATNEVGDIEALGIIETFSAASSIIAGDAAVKSADVKLIEIRLARGLGGKAYAIFTGDIGAVKAAEQSAILALEDSGMIVDTVVIPSPHYELKDIL